MTNDEKAKAYEMALEAARKELGVDRKEWEVVEHVLRNIFPELRESEDERIRKALIDALKVSETVGELKFRLPEPTREDAITYLEKQKPIELELKIPDWAYERWDDKYMINTVIDRYSLHAVVAKHRGDTYDYNFSKSTENWLRNVVKPLILEKQKEQKPAEWSVPKINGEPIPTENQSVDIPLAE